MMLASSLLRLGVWRVLPGLHKEDLGGCSRRPEGVAYDGVISLIVTEHCIFLIVQTTKAALSALREVAGGPVLSYHPPALAPRSLC